MSIFPTIMTCLGCALGIIVLAMIALGIANECLERLGRILEIGNRDKIELGKRQAGEDIARMSYWFSESDDAMNALAIVGELISRNGTFDVDSARETWRKRRAVHSNGHMDLSERPA